MLKADLNVSKSTIWFAISLCKQSPKSAARHRTNKTPLSNKMLDVNDLPHGLFARMQTAIYTSTL